MKKVLSFCCSGPRNRTVLPVIKPGKRSMKKNTIQLESVNINYTKIKLQI